MKIWVDADACPKAIKEILFRAAQREQLELTLVANQALSVPSSAFINSIRVRSGFDEADDEIRHCHDQRRPGTNARRRPHRDGPEKSGGLAVSTTNSDTQGGIFPDRSDQKGVNLYARKGGGVESGRQEAHFERTGGPSANGVR